jgi:dTMP kinase
MTNKTHGKFIAFEGLDGSGSSTQAELLANSLKKMGHKAYTTKEPTNNLIGGLIRGTLTKDWSASPECLQLLFAADRAHHLDRTILPVIDKGNFIISDRYFFSTIAFGSIAIDKKWLTQINSRFILPTLTFLIKVSPVECIKRIGKNRAQFELFEEKEKLQKIWRTYAMLAKDKKNKIIVINGERSIETISTEILSIVKEKLL